MRSIIPFLTCVALFTLHHPLSAQTPTLEVPSPEAMEQMTEAATRMTESAKRMMNPAALVLAHRNELQLSAEQVTALERLRDQMGFVVDQRMAR